MQENRMGILYFMGVNLFWNAVFRLRFVHTETCAPSKVDTNDHTLVSCVSATKSTWRDVSTGRGSSQVRPAT